MYLQMGLLHNYCSSGVVMLYNSQVICSKSENVWPKNTHSKKVCMNFRFEINKKIFFPNKYDNIACIEIYIFDAW